MKKEAIRSEKSFRKNTWNIIHHGPSLPAGQSTSVFGREYYCGMNLAPIVLWRRRGSMSKLPTRVWSLIYLLRKLPTRR